MRKIFEWLGVLWRERLAWNVVAVAATGTRSCSQGKPTSCTLSTGSDAFLLFDVELALVEGLLIKRKSLVMFVFVVCALWQQNTQQELFEKSSTSSSSAQDKPESEQQCLSGFLSHLLC